MNAIQCPTKPFFGNKVTNWHKFDSHSNVTDLTYQLAKCTQSNWLEKVQMKTNFHTFKICLYQPCLIFLPYKA